MNNKKDINTWIIGCGHIGVRVSQLLRQQNIKISATSHNENSKQHLTSIGIRVFSANLDEVSSLKNLPLQYADIFYFAPPAASGDTDQRISHFLSALEKKAPPRRIVYISTTGVYGNQNGEWITEKTPTAPHNARSKRRLSAEIQIRDFCYRRKTQYMILRVAGIYDTKKLPLEKINAGVKVLKTDIAPASNRIHAADLADICIAAMQSTHSNEIFNIADGNPSSISDYFIQTAKIFKLTPPQEINWEQAKKKLSPEMLSYLSESKKIDATYVQKKLGVALQYPDLNSGLIACKSEYDKQ